MDNITFKCIIFYFNFIINYNKYIYNIKRYKYLLECNKYIINFNTNINKCLYLYKNTNFLYHYYMRDEMKAINFIFICYLIIQIINYILLSILMNINSNNYNLWHIQFIYIITQMILIGILCFVCTGWVIALITKEYSGYHDAQHCPLNDEQSHHSSGKFRFLHITNTASFRPGYNNNNNNNKDRNNGDNNNDDDDDENMRIRYVHRTKKGLEDIEISKKLKLPQILSANESFTLFMQHLSRESSATYNNVACLLSFVEYVQFKQLLKDNLRGIQAGTFGNAKLAPSIPKSSIVHTEYNKIFSNNDENGNDINNDDDGKNHQNQDEDDELLLKEYKCRAYMLYNKYIKLMLN